MGWKKEMKERGKGWAEGQSGKKGVTKKRTGKEKGKERRKEDWRGRSKAIVTGKKKIKEVKEGEEKEA